MSSNNISRYSPGFNINDVQRKYKIKKIVKLSSNENPFTSDRVSKYISKHNHDINLYPESKTSHLQALIAKTIGYKLNAILPSGVRPGTTHVNGLSPVPSF